MIATTSAATGVLPATRQVLAAPAVTSLPGYRSTRRPVALTCASRPRSSVFCQNSASLPSATPSDMLPACKTLRVAEGVEDAVAGADEDCCVDDRRQD
jgi:hypothetical protein